jgi:signal peptidase II
LTVAVTIIFIDQLTKFMAESFLTPYQPVTVIPSVLNFTLAFNDRAAFSLGGGSTWVFTITSTLAALALLYFVPKFRTKSWLVLGGLAIGGVVGNLIDRLTKSPGFPGGYVTDYIQVPFNFPVFNLADSAICIAAFWIALRVIRGERIGGKK